MESFAGARRPEKRRPENNRRLPNVGQSQARAQEFLRGGGANLQLLLYFRKSLIRPL